MSSERTLLFIAKQRNNKSVEVFEVKYDVISGGGDGGARNTHTRPLSTRD